MSSPRKNIVERDSIVEEDLNSPGNNDDTSNSAEIFEAARQTEDMEESKKLLGNASDADVSNFSSSDSIQTIIEGDIIQKSGAGLQRSPKQIFGRIKLEECKDKESSDEAYSKLSEKKSPRQGKKSSKKTVDLSIEVEDSDAGCSFMPRQVSEHDSRTTVLDTKKEADCEHSIIPPVKISVQDMDRSDGMPERPSEDTSKKRILKKSPEKFKKTRLGSSEIAADVIEDAVDPTDDSVFTTVGSADFLTANYPNPAIVTDLTEDAVDNTDQVVFTKVSSDLVVATGSEEICDLGLIIDENVPLDHTDRTENNESKSLDIIAAELSTVLHREVSPQPQISKHNEQTAQVEGDSQTPKFQESHIIDDSLKVNIFGQVTQVEGGNISDKNTESFKTQNIDIEKTESSCGSEPSDEKMEFSNASTVPSGIGYGTDVEKMDYSSDTYSELENFKIDGDSNATLEKMECKSASSASEDKMDTESLSLKSNETDGMEFSSESASNFDKTSMIAQDNESVSVLGYESTSGQTEPTNVHENITSLQESESFKVEENKSVDVQENTPVVVQVIESIGHQENEYVDTQEHYAVEVTESSFTSVQETYSASGQENTSTNTQETKCISDQKNQNIIVQEIDSTSVPENESTSVSENKPLNVSQVEESINPIPESLSCLIGDFVSRTIQETVSHQPREPLSCLIDFSAIGQSLARRKSTDSDSNSNEIKAIIESSTVANTGTGRKFAIPHKESSDTENYELVKKQVCDQESVDKKPGDTSLKRKSLEVKIGEATEEDKQSTSSAAELPDKDKVEFEDNDKKGSKKLKK